MPPSRHLFEPFRRDNRHSSMAIEKGDHDSLNLKISTRMVELWRGLRLVT